MMVRIDHNRPGAEGTDCERHVALKFGAFCDLRASLWRVVCILLETLVYSPRLCRSPRSCEDDLSAVTLVSQCFSAFHRGSVFYLWRAP